MRAGKSTAPSGPLVVKARDGDRDYFPAGPVAGRAGLVTGLRAPERRPCAEEQPDAEAKAAVAALEADPARAGELALLDAAVRNATGLSASLAERVFRDPALLRGYRRHAWREHHPLAG